MAKARKTTERMRESNATSSDAVAEANRRLEKAKSRRARSLNLSSLGLAVLPDSLESIHEELEVVDLSHNAISSLPVFFVRLGRLRAISLKNNRLTTLPDSLHLMDSLETLTLSNNLFADLPSSLTWPRQLRQLDLDGNHISSLPESITGVLNLRGLDVSRNRLSSLPNSLDCLTDLQNLRVSANQLESLPPSIRWPSKLRELDLSDNELSSLPESMAQLIGLRMLDMTNNRLLSIPRALTQLKRLKELYLHGNDRLGIPREVLGYSREALGSLAGAGPAVPERLLRYYFKVRGAKRPLNEVKLILLGRGGVGKTSLVNRLVRDEFLEISPKTEGIIISQWPIDVRDEAVKLHIWDFGGQEMMHATHQFFLSERSVYLVVLSGREGIEDEDAEYWLKLVASFGGDSPIVVVLNKIGEHRFDLNRRALQQKYPAIRAFVSTDCKTRVGISELRDTLTETLSVWRAWRVNFPAAWFEIKERLSGMAESYLSFEEFQRICRDRGEDSLVAHVALASYLNDLGIALNYKDDPRLRDTHVLNPHWVTGGIYRILNAPILAARKGELHFDDLSDFLPGETYPGRMHAFLVDLMRKFELCFQFQDGSERYLVPELLDKQQASDADHFIPEQSLGFEYHYPILPEGLLSRFIVRTHAISEGQPRWRTGVILHFEGCRALIKADVQDKRVRILVNGPPNNRRRLLAVVRSDFDRIHASIPELKPKQFVPVPGRPDQLIEYAKLVALEKQGRSTYEELIGEDVVPVRVSNLLEGVDLSRQSRMVAGDYRAASRCKLFYSYSHKDESLRNELETHLKILERSGRILPWSDRMIRPGDDWSGEIDSNLETADVVLFLISADFIASDYCYCREMTVALDRERAGSARVIPIILRDVNWHNAPFAYLQALPKDGKAVTLWNDRDSAWRDVSEGIEKCVQSIRDRNR
jgi:internalin A